MVTISKINSKFARLGISWCGKACALGTHTPRRREAAERERHIDGAAPAERQRLMEAAVRPVLKLIIRTLYVTGLRISECMALLKADLGGAIHAANGSRRAYINGKGEKKGAFGYQKC